MNPPEFSRLILASASPRRRELLASLGARFDVVTATVDEHEAEDADPRALVTHNAALKADWVAARHPDALVLGADTTVFVDGTVLNKPADIADARRMLRLLSGRAHSVFTGLALRCHARGLSEDHGVESRVYFRALDESTIDRYLAAAHALDKAGAYGIQDHGEIIIERHEGSLTNIIGLPLEETKAVLTRLRMLPSSP
ncbi:MAG: septum formation protein Maf [Opitutaceae bacterium]|nr:septum formation protein Maf [Opitutaceae bacterium]